MFKSRPFFSTSLSSWVDARFLSPWGVGVVWAKRSGSCMSISNVFWCHERKKSAIQFLLLWLISGKNIFYSVVNCAFITHQHIFLCPWTEDDTCVLISWECKTFSLYFNQVIWLASSAVWPSLTRRSSKPRPPGYSVIWLPDTVCSFTLNPKLICWPIGRLRFVWCTNRWTM